MPKILYIRKKHEKDICLIWLAATVARCKGSSPGSQEGDDKTSCYNGCYYHGCDQFCFKPQIEIGCRPQIEVIVICRSQIEIIGRLKIESSKRS